MTGKNQIRKKPHRRLKILVAVQSIWVAIVCAMGVWWGILMTRQSRQIAELQMRLGAASGEVNLHWLRTQRMLHWESAFFVFLLIVISGLLIWLYWRDLKRTRSIEAFFASVTHELRTPLTSIRLQAESIADNSSPENKALVDRLLEDTMRLEGQVERTLELARVEGGGPVLLQPLQIRPWLGRLVQSWNEIYGARAVIEAKIDDLTVEADPNALQVVLKNLMENSIRHSRKETVRIGIQVVAENGNAKLLFGDDGTGYPGDVRDLGRLFHRGASSQGSGVGLYLVQALMTRMGGKARFSNDQGFRAELSLRGHAHG